jgi:hypothetical protein
LEFMVHQKPAGIPDCPAVTAMAIFDAADVSYVIPIESTAGAGRGVAIERGAGVALNCGAGSGRRGGGAEKAGRFVTNPLKVNIVSSGILLVFIFSLVVCSRPPRRSRPVLGARTFLTEI